MQAYIHRLEAHLASAQSRCSQLSSHHVSSSSPSSLLPVGAANPNVAARKLDAIERANRLAKRRLATASLRRLASQIAGAAAAAGLTSTSGLPSASSPDASESAEATLAKLAKEADDCAVLEDVGKLDEDNEIKEASNAVTSPEILASALQARACLDCLSARRSVAADTAELASLAEQFSRHLQLAGLSPADADLVVSHRLAAGGADDRAGADARRRYAASLLASGAAAAAANEHASAVALRRRLIGATSDRLRSNQAAIAALLRADARVDLAEQRRLASRILVDGFQRPDSELAALVEEAASAAAAAPASAVVDSQTADGCSRAYRCLAGSSCHSLQSLHRLLENEIRLAESRSVDRRANSTFTAAAASLRRSVDLLERRRSDTRDGRQKARAAVEQLLTECEPLVDQLASSVDSLRSEFSVHRSQPAFRLTSPTSAS